MKKIISILASGIITFSYSALGAQPPEGDYKSTCSPESFFNDTLVAKCKNDQGVTVTSTLSYASSCVGAISNVNGVLVCSGVTGSYAKTCNDIGFYGGVLYATCLTSKGKWIDSSIQFQGRNHPVHNCEGTLKDTPTC